jgi:hypothetical protein
LRAFGENLMGRKVWFFPKLRSIELFQIISLLF